MNRLTTCALAALLLLGGVTVAQAQSGDKADTKYAKAKGPYAYGGLAIAKTNYGGSADPNIGFAFGGGYRFLDWLAADADFYWAGRDQGAFKTRQFGVTFNAKA